MSERLERLAKKALALAAGGAVVGVSAYLAFASMRAVRPNAAPTAVSSTRPAAVLSVAAAVAPPAAPSGMRAKIREAIENASLKSAAELDDFLVELEEQARRRGRVTALDVAPGLAKCREYDEPEKAARFSERMMQLQQELSLTQPEPPADLPAARTRAAELLQTIRTSRGAEKQQLVLAYLRQIGQLPEEERAELEQQLNETAGRTRPMTDGATLDALYQGIERAADEEERRALIREYRSLVLQLPAEESAGRLAALNRFAKPGSRTKADIEP